MRSLFVICTLALFVTEGCVSVESSKYAVIEGDHDFELRQYEPRIVAETVVQSDFSKAGNVGFRRLANYIFGENISQAKIAMTAPVGQSAASEKIAMTAPVGQRLAAPPSGAAAGGDGEYTISFTMPSNYTLASLPKPKDPLVLIRELPAKKFAAITFSGTWSESRYQERLARLRQWLESHHLQAQGEPSFARYDPPWTLWFMRRNEILIEVR